VHISEVMTHGVVTAEVEDSLRHVGELMRDRNVGSVVVCDGGRPVGVITDRDLALAVVADRVEAGDTAGAHASRPLVTGESEMDLEEAVALMIQHRIRRLPVTEGEELVGIVTIDDLAVGERVSKVVEPEDSDYYPPRVSRPSEPRSKTSP
jgi:CBS domain-containing protein